MAERVRPHGQDCERAKAKLGPSGYAPATPATNGALTLLERVQALEEALIAVAFATGTSSLVAAIKARRRGSR